MAAVYSLEIWFHTAEKIRNKTNSKNNRKFFMRMFQTSAANAHKTWPCNGGGGGGGGDFVLV